MSMPLPDIRSAAGLLVRTPPKPEIYSWEIADIARMCDLPEIETLYKKGDLGEVVLFEKTSGNRTIKIVFENWPESEPFKISSHTNIDVAGPKMVRPTKMFHDQGLCLSVQCHMPGHKVADDFVAVAYSFMKGPSDASPTRVRFAGYFGSPVLSDPEAVNLFKKAYLYFPQFEDYFAFLAGRDQWLHSTKPLQNTLQIAH